MAKSARRRNAKKTVGRTKRYKRKTMRKRKKGGMPKEEKLPTFTSEYSLPLRSVSAPPEFPPKPGGYQTDSDTASIKSDEMIIIPKTVSESPGTLKKEQQMEEVKYTIKDNDDNWLVAILIDGTKETYAVPKEILSKVRWEGSVTALG